MGIVLSLVSDGSLTQWELRRRFGKSKSTISYYMSRLESAAIVHAYGGFGAKRYDLTNRRRTVLLLSAFAGSLRDHLEAFTDLWMSLVERTPIRHQNSEDIPRT